MTAVKNETINRSKYSLKNKVKADNNADIIKELERNAGWYTDDNGAFKVEYIEEVVE